MWNVHPLHHLPHTHTHHTHKHTHTQTHTHHTLTHTHTQTHTHRTRTPTHKHTRTTPTRTPTQQSARHSLNCNLKIFKLRAIPIAVCLYNSPQTLPKPVFQNLPSSASFFNLEYLHYSIRSSSGCLRLLPRLPVSSKFPSFFLPITCYRRQFLRKMSPIQLAFLLYYAL
jgi:hypothetical protein